MRSVSIALATYNGARFLEEQLRSLAAQSLRPCELVVSDDGSSDSTLAVVRAFAEVAPFPVVVLEGGGRLGYRLNFRRAAQACTGDLIAFCDQDDIWRADKLEVMAKCFDDPDVLLAYHNATVFGDAGTRPLHRAAEEHADLSEGRPFKAVNGLLQTFRADLRRFDPLWDQSIDQNEGNVILAHDQWYFLLAQLLGKVAFVDQPLLDYRQHGSNTYGVKVRETWLSRLALRFLHFGDQDAWAALSAESRANIAEAIARTEGRQDVSRRAEEYRSLAARLRRRARTYSAPDPMARAASLARSLAMGDYRGGPWAFHRGSAVRDAWSGVLLRKKSDPVRG